MKSSEKLYDTYNTGIRQLLRLLDPRDPDYPSVSDLQVRFKRITSRVAQSGTTDRDRAELTHIVAGLDQICGRHFQYPFQDFYQVSEKRTEGSYCVEHNLPRPDCRRFVGREAERRKIEQFILEDSDSSVMVVTGVAGVGKTVTVLDAIYPYVWQRGSDMNSPPFHAVIWTSAKETVLETQGLAHRFTGEQTIYDIFTTISLVLKQESITRARREEQFELVRMAFSQQRVLLIVDQLEAAKDATQIMQYLLELPPSTKSIITSRELLNAPIVLRLNPLPREDSMSLIDLECAQKGITLSSTARSDLCAGTAGIPLAMVWSIARIAFGHPPAEVLLGATSPLSDLARFCLTQVIERIANTDAYTILLAASLFISDCRREALQTVVRLDESSFRMALDSLIRLFLLQEVDESISILPITTRYAAEQLQSNIALRNMLRRNYVNWAIELVITHSDWEFSLSSFTVLLRELDNLVAAIAQIASPSEAIRATALISQTSLLLHGVGRWADMAAMLEHVLQAWNTPDTEKLRAEVLIQLGRHLGHLSDGQRATRILSEARQIAERTDDQVLLAQALLRMGQGQLISGAPESAIITLQKARAVAKAAHIERVDIAAADFLGQAYVSLGQSIPAAEILFDAVERSERLNWGRSAGHGHCHLGEMELQLKNTSQAEVHFGKALRLGETWSDTRLQGLALFGLAKVRFLEKDCTSAHGLATEALGLFEKKGMKRDAQKCREFLQGLEAQTDSNAISPPFHCG